MNQIMVLQRGGGSDVRGLRRSLTYRSLVCLRTTAAEARARSVGIQMALGQSGVTNTALALIHRSLSTTKASNGQGGLHQLVSTVQSGYAKASVP